MKKILAIDDQKDNLTTLKAVIKSHLPNCKIITALSGKEGIEKAKKEQPDTILLDIIMPKMDGYEVCQKLKRDEKTKHIPIILVTAIKTDAESRVKGLNLGAEAFISKPIDAVELSAQINVMLRIKAAEDQLRAEKNELGKTAKKKTAQLIEKEKQFQLIAENTIDNLAITTFDLKAKYLYVSPSIKNVLGYDEEDLMGKSFFDFIHPNDKKALYPLLLKYVNLKVKNLLTKSKLPFSQTVEFRFRNKAGEWIFMQSVINIVDKKLLAVTRDITKQKRAEEALKESEERYKSFIRHSNEGIYRMEMKTPMDISLPIEEQIDYINQNAYYAECNEAFAKMYGAKSINDILNILRVDFSHRRNDKASRENMLKFIESGYQIFNAESFEEVENGNWKWFSNQTIGVVEDGKLSRIWGTQINITDRKNAEQALKDSEERFKELIELLPEAIFETDENLKLTYVNKRALEISGYTEADFQKGIDGLSILSPESQLRAQKYLSRRLSGEVLGTIEYDAQKKDGTTYPILFNANSIIKNGQFSGLRGVILDITERRKAQHDLILSEEKFRKAFLTSPDSIAFNQLANGKFVSINDGCTKILGYSEKEVIGKTALDFKIWANKEERKKLYEELLKNGVAKNLETNFRAKNGDLKIGLMSASVVVLEGEKYILSITRDITKRREAEKAYFESAEKYRVLYTSTNDAIFLMQDLTFISCNPKTLEMYGCKEDEIIGHTPIEFSPKIQPDGKESVKLAVKKIDAALAGEPQIFEWLHLKKDGTPFNAEVSLTKMSLSDGDYIHAIVRDITDRKRSEQIQKALYNISNAVIESENLEEFISLIQIELGDIIDTTNFFIAFYNKENDTFFSPFMSDEKDNFDTWPAGKTMSSYVVKTTKSLFVTETDLRRMESEEKIEIVGTIPKCGMIVPLNYKGETTGVFAIQSYTNENAYTKEDLDMLEFVSDQISISIHRKNAEQSLKDALKKATESDRLKSTFLATMSHELRTPLNAIIGFSDIIDNNLSMDEILQFAQTINDSGNHLLNIVEDLFDITLIESGQIKIDKEEIPLIQILNNVNEIIKAEQKKTGKSNLDLKLHIPPNLEDLIIYTDRSKFKQVLINLLKNAIKFTAKGEVSYGFEEEIIEGKSFIKFFVKDTGIGIREDQQELIFDLFRQADETYTTAHGGTGIGLSITKKLTELMGGKIWLISERGRGSTFYFTIPNENNLELNKTDTIRDMDKHSLKTKTILIAEDVEASYLLIEAMLSKLQAKLIWAKDGEDAIKLCEDNPQVDLVLMDINMPIINGYDATKIIKEIRPDLPIIAQTAYAIIGDREKSIEAGCNDYISKPIKKDALINIIHKHMK